MLTKYALLATCDFSQYVSQPTHLAGNILDHLYITGFELDYIKLQHPYFSDHDAVFEMISPKKLILVPIDMLESQNLLQCLKYYIQYN